MEKELNRLSFVGIESQTMKLKDQLEAKQIQIQARTNDLQLQEEERAIQHLFKNSRTVDTRIYINP